MIPGLKEQAGLMPRPVQPNPEMGKQSPEPSVSDVDSPAA